MSDANWDSFEESRSAFDDFNWVLEKTLCERSQSCQRRIALLMYCQAVEMTAPHLGGHPKPAIKGHFKTGQR
jgi:hypothetical protein